MNKYFFAKWPKEIFLIFLALIFMWPAGCGWLKNTVVFDNKKSTPKSTAEVGPTSQGVYGPLASGGVAPADGGFLRKFHAVWVGSYLDEAPAHRAVLAMQKEGLVAFTVKRTLVEQKIASDKPIGDFYLVLTGLFGLAEDAEILGRRLVAKGLTNNWQVVPADDPGELGLAKTQTAPILKKAEKQVEIAREGAGRPLAPDSPAATGQAFKKVVYGRYVGSFKDIQEAKTEAARLTAAGWPAALEENGPGGQWYRVYMAEPSDHRNYTVDSETLNKAKASAASQPGLVLLVDTSGLKGSWGVSGPSPGRIDASACAGYSQAGRLLTNLERLITFVPDSNYLMVVKTLAYNPAANPAEWAIRPFKALWTGDDSEYANSKAIYGPAIYNRPEVLARVKTIAPDSKVAPLGAALRNLGELNAIPGRKIVLLYSDFKNSDKPSDVEAAIGRIKGQFGNALDFKVIYGDTDDKGYQMAENLARVGGSAEAWDGCRLLVNPSYFEKFIKSIFK